MPLRVRVVVVVVVVTVMVVVVVEVKPLWLPGVFVAIRSCEQYMYHPLVAFSHITTKTQGRSSPNTSCTCRYTCRLLCSWTADHRDVHSSDDCHLPVVLRASTSAVLHVPWIHVLLLYMCWTCAMWLVDWTAPRYAMMNDEREKRERERERDGFCTTRDSPPPGPPPSPPSPCLPPHATPHDLSGRNKHLLSPCPSRRLMSPDVRSPRPVRLASAVHCTVLYPAHRSYAARGWGPLEHVVGGSSR
jgi:hypothetical protein